jgi:hypothetical protein
MKPSMKRKPVHAHLRRMKMDLCVVVPSVRGELISVIGDIDDRAQVQMLREWRRHLQSRPKCAESQSHRDRRKRPHPGLISQIHSRLRFCRWSQNDTAAIARSVAGRAAVGRLSSDPSYRRRTLSKCEPRSRAIRGSGSDREIPRQALRFTPKAVHRNRHSGNYGNLATRHV